MVFCIERFSSSLCLVYSTDQGVSDLYPDCFDLTEPVYGIICKLQELYEEEFDIVLAKIFNSKEYRCSEFHMKIILSSCMKLSSTQSYFHFMVVSSLISATVFDLFTKVKAKCFIFAKIASLCLIAVYDRCYKNFFKENEESDSLDSFCERIWHLSLTEGDESILQLASQHKINPLIASLCDVDAENFELYDSEMEMLDDIIRSNPPEEIKEDPAILLSRWGEFHYSSDDKSDVEEAMDCLNLGEISKYSSRLNRICEFCGRKCFKLLMAFERHIKKKRI
ncbi:hypothetical protein AVEN_88642-1 [Araneus ventricosus]|uniref:Uncharacterized protein n=1 Tax=Araneus ventricosus TaxID=182803 RepID=A0A4Y2PCY6_ARAVE|nr:hypothetical protein AVEN_88642-1 [Araneus ventricosus]